jgi:hypothetical protein
MTRPAHSIPTLVAAHWMLNGVSKHTPSEKSSTRGKKAVYARMCAITYMEPMIHKTQDT